MAALFTIRRGMVAGVLAIGCLAAVAQVPGGWSKAAVDDPEVVAAAAFAIEARGAGKADDAGPLALVKILAAEQQVVAGMNYRITMEVTIGDDVRKAEATVWARVWLEKDERYQLTAWRFVDGAAN